MFDVTAQLVNNQEQINSLDKIQWEKNSWKRSLIGDETVIILHSTKVYVFSDSVLWFGKVFQHPESNEVWKIRVAGVRGERSYRDFEDVSGESTEFEWNIFPGFTSLQLCDKISNLLSSSGQTPESFTGRVLFTSKFNYILCDRKDNKEQCLKNAEFVKVFARSFVIGQWSIIGPGSEKKWYLSENSPQGAWDNIAEQILLEFAETGHPIFHCPEKSWKVKENGKCPHTSVLIKIQEIQFVALFSLSISSVSTGQWELYAMNMKASKIARSNPLYWRVNQLFSEKSKLKHLLVQNLKTPIFFFAKIFSANWIGFTRKQIE